jgi:hypothetical protein
MCGDTQPLRQLLGFAQPFGLGHRFSRHVAHRNIAAFGDKLTGKLAAHSRPASRDDRDLPGKILHFPHPPFSRGPQALFSRFDLSTPYRFQFSQRTFDCSLLAGFLWIRSKTTQAFDRDLTPARMASGESCIP